MTTERPQKFTLNTQQRNILRKEGFTDYEIRAYTIAKDSKGELQRFQFNSATFVAARQSRAKWVAELKKQGWRKAEIAKKIQSYYDLKSSRSPFDWLKLSYSPTKKVTVFADAVRRQIRARVNRTFGRGYGKRKLPETRRVHLAAFPKRPKRLVRRKVGPRLPIRRGPSA